MKDINRALNIINLILAVMVMVLSILIAKESRDIKQAYEQISAEAQQNHDSLAVYQQESKAELEEIYAAYQYDPVIHDGRMDAAERAFSDVIVEKYGGSFLFLFLVSYPVQKLHHSIEFMNGNRQS